MVGAPESCFESSCALVVVDSFVVVLIYCCASETDSSCLGVSAIVVEDLEGLQDIGNMFWTFYTRMYECCP